MNAKLACIGLVIVLLTAIAKHAPAQGSFGNLDFESASFVPVPGDPLKVQFGPALPGWTGYINGEPQVAIYPNFVPLGTPIPFISVLTPPSLGNVLQGSFTLAYGTSFNVPVAVAVAQTGLVPADSQSLRLLAGLFPPEVFMDGNYLPLVALESRPLQTTLYGIDISAFAGRTVELRFQVKTTIDYLDDIRFSDQPIPEPGLFGLLAVGALLLGGRFVCRHEKTT